MVGLVTCHLSKKVIFIRVNIFVKKKTYKMDVIGMYDCVPNSLTLKIMFSFLMDCEGDIFHVLSYEGVNLSH